MNNSEIVEELSKKGTLRTLIQNITHSTDDTLFDLEQDIYLYLLTYDNSKLNEMYNKEQLTFFLVRMITNQFYSRNSPYYTKYKKFQRMSDEINNDDNNDDE